MLIFIDTSGFKAYYDENDDHHRKARLWMNSLSSKDAHSLGGFVTTDYILDETITLLRIAHSHQKASEFIDSMLGSKVLTVVYTNEEIFQEALLLFKQRKDKVWSFTDCVSFVVMRSMGISDSFAFDAHFGEAGFATVPS